jgi:hypothetical protein
MFTNGVLQLPGLTNPLLVGELFREYSQPWEGLSRAYIKETWDTTSRFLNQVLSYLPMDDDTHNKIRQFWLNSKMMERLETAFDKLHELLDVHKEYPMTANRYFMRKTKQLRQKHNELQGKLAYCSHLRQAMKLLTICIQVQAIVKILIWIWPQPSLHSTLCWHITRFAISYVMNSEPNVFTDTQ